MDRKEYHRRYYQENKERLAEQQRRYREENKERLAEQKRRYYQEKKQKSEAIIQEIISKRPKLGVYYEDYEQILK